MVKTLKTMNPQGGFFGTIQRNTCNTKSTEKIWISAVKRLQKLYPNKSEKEIVEFLDSRVGRHFADSIVDSAGKLSALVIELRVSMLNKLNTIPWWNYFSDKKSRPQKIDKKALYRCALRYEMNCQAKQNIMTEILGDKNIDLNKWLESEHTTENEMFMMWASLHSMNE